MPCSQRPTFYGDPWGARSILLPSDLQIAAPSYPNNISLQFGHTLVPSPVRPRKGIGFYPYNWSSDLEQTRDPLVPLGAEKGLEVSCKLAVTRWLILTADLQWIDPGKANVASETVAGLRAQVRF